MSRGNSVQPVIDESPTLAQAISVWWRIGLLSFGGPAAQIALMHRMLVDERSWLSEKEYLNALSFCMLLPGPEAMQIATYAGWRLHGWIGGLVAGLLFVIPGALVILLLAVIYAEYGNVPLLHALFLGVKAAVIIIVIEALLRVAKRALVLTWHWVIAWCAFVGIFFFEVPYPYIILFAAMIGGYAAGLLTAEPSTVGRGGSERNGEQIDDLSNRSNNRLGLSLAMSGRSAQRSLHLRSLLPGTFKTIALWLTLWLVPLLTLDLFSQHRLMPEIGYFFSKLALVTFGGAYAVLAYLAQDVVNQFGWLTTGEMMDGLGLAETTPGPLILVTEFVGFIAAYREGGLALGLVGALVTLWVTFSPCFLWIFAGAPYIDWISEQPRLRGALAGITAAVTGVILSLSIWFALHVLFKSIGSSQIGPVKFYVPDWQSLDWRVLLLSVMCAILMFKLHWSIARVLVLSSLLGLGLTALV